MTLLLFYDKYYTNLLRSTDKMAKRNNKTLIY